ncbi:cytochrome P450 2H1-like [Rhineura floridana]|uniref:cytochrome P450 2H1-like n=1 Tax=Rhineura floridana TaxID=261503 RepID=UPI002AC808DA|nr:cytochrome P450 2H1-like [Rhineura floridana]
MEPLGATNICLMLCAACLFFLSAWRKVSGRERLPPGPYPLPLVGNILQLDTRDFPRSLEKLSLTYGSVFTIYLGSQPAVVLYGHEVVTEALLAQGDEFSARGNSPILEKTANGTGIGFSNGETWKQLRQFAVATLHNLGMGGKSIEERIQEEAGFLVERLRSTNGRPFDPTRFLSSTATNIICSITFGSRFDYEDKDFLEFIHLLEENARLQSCTMTKLYNIFPAILEYFPGSHKKIFKNTEELKHFISRKVKTHQESLTPNQPQDFIHAFLIKMEQEKQNSQSVFDLQSLLRSTLDLFIAGAESTSLVLKYALLTLMKHPEVEEKVHQEIDHVISQSRRPCMADLGKMPYTDAVIHEIHRCLALVPLNVPHAVTRDTCFRQYLIPKGTTIFAALKPSLYDCREFPNPQQFDPGHFLDAKGGLRKSEFFIPFSTGKRACLGEKLVAMTVFVVLTAILQHFDLVPLTAPEDLDTSPTPGFLTVAPKPYQLCVAPR